MGFFDLYLTLWVFLYILIDIWLGHLTPGAFQAVGAIEVAQINLPVAVLIWPVCRTQDGLRSGAGWFTKLEGRLKRRSRQRQRPVTTRPPLSRRAARGLQFSANRAQSRPMRRSTLRAHRAYLPVAPRR